MKNITVLTGSPREGGNSDLLAKAYIRGAEEAGHSVRKIDLRDGKVTPCIACDCCYSNGKACVHDDCFDEVAEAVIESDVVTFVMPVYWYSFPAQLKAAIDKFYSFIIGGKDVTGKTSQLIICGEAGDEAVFDGLLTSWRMILKDRKWVEGGNLILTHVGAKGAVAETDGLARAEKLGKEI